MRGLLAVAAILALAACAGGAGYDVKAVNYQLHKAAADDGVHIALHRYNGAGGSISSLRPVIVCPGICSNQYSFIADPDGGLVGALVESGRDVWVVELRGHGESDSPRNKRSMEYDWDMDDYARKDLPAAIGYVAEQTGADGVDYVGHSMGGMVAYIALSSGGLPQVRSLVIVASPATLEQPSRWIGALFGMERTLVRIKRLPAAFGAKLGAMLPEGIDFVTPTLYNPDNVSREVSRRLLRRGVNDLGRAEALQWLAIKKGGGLTDASGGVDYLAMMGDIRTPALVIAGSADETAQPHEVRRGFEALGSADKTYVLIGRANGASMDYGHMDLVHGSNAPMDVYPLIIKWLDEHR